MSGAAGRPATSASSFDRFYLPDAATILLMVDDSDAIASGEMKKAWPIR